MSIMYINHIWWHLNYPWLQISQQHLIPAYRHIKLLCLLTFKHTQSQWQHTTHVPLNNAIRNACFPSQCKSNNCIPWRFKSSDMWQCVVRQIVPGVLKHVASFTFKIKQQLHNDFGISQLLTQWHAITLEIQTVSDTAARTSNFAG